MDYVTRINLKPDCGGNRSELINYCLNRESFYTIKFQEV